MAYQLPSPSVYQRRLIDVVVGGENAISNSVAGSGKSTTGMSIVKDVLAVRPDQRILLVCFQKNVRKDFQDRAKDVFSQHILDNNLTIQTSYSLGYELIRNHIGPREVNGTRINYRMAIQLRKLYNQYGESRALEMFGAPLEEIKRPMMAWYTLSALRVIDNFDDLFKIESERQLFNKEPNETMANIIWDMLDYAHKSVTEGDAVWNSDLKETVTKFQIDYTDMVREPAIRNLRGRSTYNLIIVDEAQDTSVAQLKTIKSYANSDTQWVFLCDRQQAIMQFAGAQITTVDMLKSHFDCEEVRIPVSYRIPLKVRDEARKYVPDIDCPEGVKGGFVGRIRIQKALEKVKPGDLVIARTIGQLMEFAVIGVAKGIPMSFRGADIKGIILDALTTIKNHYHYFSFEQSVLEYVDDHVKTIRERDGDHADEDKILNIKRLGKGLIALHTYAQTQGIRGADAFQKYVDGLFVKDPDSEKDIVHKHKVMCLTIHQSKGGEANTVWLLMPDGGLPYRTEGMTQSQMQEEDNIAYVAVTRAKQALWYVLPDTDLTTTEVLDEPLPITTPGPLIQKIAAMEAEVAFDTAIENAVGVLQPITTGKAFDFVISDDWTDALGAAMKQSTKMQGQEYRDFKTWFRREYQATFANDAEALKSLDTFFREVRA